MPPKKRALAETDANAQPAPKRSQKQKQPAQEMDQDEHSPEVNASEAESTHELEDEEVESKQPHDWICIEQPYWCKSADSDDDDDVQQNDDGHETEMFPKPASEHPDWNWVMLWQTWTAIGDHMRLAQYTDPDNFDMYIYNDFHWYGMAELIENLLVDFDKARTRHAKVKDETYLLDMWATVATLGHWTNAEDASSFMMMDDGERACQLVGLIGTAFITMLDILDLEQKLDDTVILDLGLVISLFCKSCGSWVDCEADDVEWQPWLTAYAKKAGIDLRAKGCDGIDETVDRLDEGLELGKRGSKRDRFGWANKLKEYKQHHGIRGKIGGTKFNIMKFSRQERAAHAFDHKDPLANFSIEEIKEGKLMIG